MNRDPRSFYRPGRQTGSSKGTGEISLIAAVSVKSTTLFCSTNTLERNGSDFAVYFQQQLIRIENGGATVIRRSERQLSEHGSPLVFARSGEDILAFGLPLESIVYRSVGKYFDLRFDVRWFQGANNKIDLAPIKSPRRASRASLSPRVAFVSDDHLWIFDPEGDDVECHNVFNVHSFKDVALFNNGKSLLLAGNGFVALPVEDLSVPGAIRERTVETGGVYNRCAIDSDEKHALCGTVDGFLDIVEIQ